MLGKTEESLFIPDDHSPHMPFINSEDSGAISYMTNYDTQEDRAELVRPELPIFDTDSSHITSDHRIYHSPGPFGIPHGILKDDKPFTVSPVQIPLPVSDTKIRFFQNNINRTNPTMHLILNEMIGNFDVILVQEPWNGFIGTARSDTNPEGTAILGQVNHSSWHQFIPCPVSEDKSRTPRVSAYVSKAISKIQVTQRADIITHRDILPIQFSNGDHSLLVINIYNDSKGTALDALMRTSLPNIPMIISGDFNLHNPLWSKYDSKTPMSPQSNDLIKWAETMDLHLCNQPGEIMFHRAGTSSVLDLTWASSSIMLNGLEEWCINTDLSTNSDHIPSTWSVTLSSH